MTCDERNEQLSALLDGELAVGEAAELAQHLAACPACARRLADLAHLRAALAQSVPTREPSPELRARVEALLDAETEGAAVSDALRPSRRSVRPRLAWVSAAAAIAAALVILFWRPEDRSGEFMAVRDAALRANVTQTSAGSIRAPVVRGFTLASARADVVAGHRARVLVYSGAGGAITLCVWPANGEPAHGVRSAVYQGAEISYWNNGANEFWAVSAKPGAGLASFVQAIAKS